MKYQFKTSDEAWIAIALDKSKRTREIAVKERTRNSAAIMSIIVTVLATVGMLAIAINPSASVVGSAAFLSVIYLFVRQHYKEQELELKLLKAIDALQKSQQNPLPESSS